LEFSTNSFEEISGQRIGSQVAIEDGNVFVSDPLGAKVFCLVQSGGQWDLSQTLEDPDLNPGENFGDHMALNGNDLFIDGSQGICHFEKGAEG